MAIINNNVQNVKFLRNQTPFESRELARQALENNKAQAADGTALLARYTADNDVKTLVGFVAEVNSTKHVTIIDVEGGSADVEALRQEINAKLGEGITSANTATAQLAALSGTSADGSGVTSVWGAKAYAYDLLGTLDYTDTAETGSYVSKVDQVDGKITTTKVELPSVTDTKEAKKVVVSVSEDKGEISIERGTISSSAETMVLTDNADGGVNFEVNIDNDTIVQDETTKALKVASAALTQYIGDGKTIQISAADAQNNKTVSTLLTLASVTPSSTTVKEEYALQNASGETIGQTIKIYKDSALYSVYLGHEDDTLSDDEDPTSIVTGSGDTALCFIYHKEDGTYELVTVNVEEFIEENEFASGVTWDSTNKKVVGVVDPTSESFLTVGADGFKISGVSGLVTNAIEALDADVSGNSTHVTVGVEEVDGVITAVTVSEDNIANANDLAGLSGKTITEANSSNSSISAETAATTDGTVKVDLTTDASKIKMTGFTADASGFTAVTTASTVTEAVKAIETAFIDNEKTVASALTDLDTRVDIISGDVDTIGTNYVSGVSVNGNAVTVADHVAPISISAATSATTASTANAIVVDTNTSTGAITLGLNYIDCGTYDNE